MTHETPNEPWASEHSPCLAKLNREHREGLVLAEEIARIAETGDDDATAQAVARVRDYNTRELEAHLQHEEQTILGPLVQEHLPIPRKLDTHSSASWTPVPRQLGQSERSDARGGMLFTLGWVPPSILVEPLAKLCSRRRR